MTEVDRLTFPLKFRSPDRETPTDLPSSPDSRLTPDADMLKSPTNTVAVADLAAEPGENVPVIVRRYLPETVEARLHWILRVELEGIKIEPLGHDAVNPEGDDVAERRTVPLKPGVLVIKRLDETPVWPAFRLAPETDKLTSPTWTVAEF